MKERIDPFKTRGLRRGSGGSGVDQSPYTIAPAPADWEMSVVAGIASGSLLSSTHAAQCLYVWDDDDDDDGLSMRKLPRKVVRSQSAMAADGLGQAPVPPGYQNHPLMPLTSVYLSRSFMLKSTSFPSEMLSAHSKIIDIASLAPSGSATAFPTTTNPLLSLTHIEPGNMERTVPRSMVAATSGESVE